MVSEKDVKAAIKIVDIFTTSLDASDQRHLIADIAAALADQRERDAVKCDIIAMGHRSDRHLSTNRTRRIKSMRKADGASECAAAIRARCRSA